MQLAGLKKVPTIHTYFGRPFVLSWDTAGAAHACPYIGSRDSAAGIAVRFCDASSGRKKVELLLKAGAIRPNVAARSAFCEEYPVIRTAIDNHSGITFEGIAGAPEAMDASIMAALKREGLEEQGIDGDNVQIQFSQYYHPAPDWSCERQQHGILVLGRGVNVEQLCAQGDESGGEVGGRLFLANFALLQRLNLQGLAIEPFPQLLMQRLRFIFPQLEWEESAMGNIPKELPIAMSFGKRKSSEKILGSDGKGFGISANSHSLEFRKKTIELSYDAMVAMPIGMDNVCFYIHYADELGTQRIFRSPVADQLVYTARRVQREALMIDDTTEREAFSVAAPRTYIEDNVVAGINCGNITVEQWAREKLKNIIGDRAAETANLRMDFGPMLPSCGLSAAITIPIDVEITDRSQLLPTDLENIDINTALAEIGEGKIKDPFFEILLLEHIYRSRISGLDIDYLGREVRTALEGFL